ncbi:MAG: UbiA family prenyltransferase, partial [Halobacteriales archaeon]
DYESAGFPMLPVVHGDAVTVRHIVYYLGATFAAAAGLAAVSGLGWLYAGVSVIVGGVFVAAVVDLHRRRSRRSALRAFHASNAYLGTLLVAVIVETLVA